MLAFRKDKINLSFTFPNLALPPNNKVTAMH